LTPGEVQPVERSPFLRQHPVFVHRLNSAFASPVLHLTACSFSIFSRISSGNSSANGPPSASMHSAVTQPFNRVLRRAPLVRNSNVICVSMT
jgi:hypothetical protein